MAGKVSLAADIRVDESFIEGTSVKALINSSGKAGGSPTLTRLKSHSDKGICGEKTVNEETGVVQRSIETIATSLGSLSILKMERYKFVSIPISTIGYRFTSGLERVEGAKSLQKVCNILDQLIKSKKVVLIDNFRDRTNLYFEQGSGAHSITFHLSN
jgi:hypothetical protein